VGPVSVPGGAAGAGVPAALCSPLPDGPHPLPASLPALRRVQGPRGRHARTPHRLMDGQVTKRITCILAGSAF